MAIIPTTVDWRKAQPRGTDGGTSAPLGPSGVIGQASQLWASLPDGVADLYRPHAPGIARGILQQIQLTVPEYAKPLEGAFGQHMTQAIERAIVHCIATIRNPNVPHKDWEQLFRNLGKVEFHEGRSLNTLQAAYRVGGRAAWRYIGEVAQKHRLPPEYLRIAAEAIFAYIDELSALSVEGYTSAQTQDVGTLARRRRRLLELILSGPTATSPQAISALADAARWQIPEWVMAVALEPREDQHEMIAPALDGDLLMDLEGTEPCLLTAEPERDLDGLAAKLEGWRAAVGPRVRLSEAATSLEWARQTMRLVQRGVIPDAALTWSIDHLSTVWLLKDDFFVSQLSNRVLAPLEGLTTKQRQRLSETLLAWLQLSGSAPEIAAKLGVHPQTVRYRLRQLEQLFGDRLADVHQRLDMELALRAVQLTAGENEAAR